MDELIPKGWNKIEAAAEKLGWDPDNLRRYVNRGRVAARKCGWTLLISDKEIARLKADPPKAGRPKKVS